VPELPRKVRPALLPLVLVMPTLMRIERARFEPGDLELPQWRRQWHLWRAARSW